MRISPRKSCESCASTCHVLCKPCARQRASLPAIRAHGDKDLASHATRLLPHAPQESPPSAPLSWPADIASDREASTTAHACQLASSLCGSYVQVGSSWCAGAWECPPPLKCISARRCGACFSPSDGPRCSLLAAGQVGSYPVLKVSRTRDWGWCLTNKFVTIVSANKP